MRSIASTATPYIPATWAAVIPYFTQARMRANWELGIWMGVIGGSVLTCAVPS